MPALATTTSSPPKRSTVSATACHHRAVVGDVGGDPDRPLADPLSGLAGLGGVEVDDRDRGAAQVHLARRLEADPAGGAGDQRHLSVQVVERHAAQEHRNPAPRITRPCPASDPSTPSSPSPSSRSGLSRAGASATSSLARSPSARARRVWNFYEGPPTANGRPGSHHVLARVFKDVYPRYRSMCGYRVPRKAGWDCHGLPVEIEVEKQLGIASKQEIEEYGIDKFNARCRESVFEYVEEWNRLTERIGFWIDLDDPYVTLDDDYIESVWWSLRKLWDDDRLYEGHKVVPYCPRCGTALSSHEVALGYQDVEDPSIYVRFPLLGEDGSETGESLLVWTTTPWTLPGNVAVAAAPDVTYVKARLGEETLIVAEPLLEKVLGEGVEVVERLSGSDLVGARYRGPVFALADGGPANAFRVLAGDFVTTEDGTGLVHIAPAFGEDDYAVAAANEIFDPTSHGTLYNPVGLDGRFDQRVSGFEGEFVKDPEVTKALIADLDKRGLLFREQVYEHAYPHCWRCGTPLLYYAKSSWYVATSQAREQLLANNETIGWHPEHIKTGRFGKWLENNVDWALSRDRYWGTPLPIWECDGEDCDGRFCAGSVAELRERARGEVPEDLHRPYIDEVVLDCERCGGEMRRVESVIDTWYDSGAMPFAQLHYPFENEAEFEERFPADFICEAIDQTRGWFYTLLAESTLLFGASSYRNCVCLGLILDPEGQKMSKSKGNVVEPWDVISSHGADAFRWYYLTAQQPWSGYRFSVDTVGESARQFINTLWNTYSFWVLYANAENLAPADFPLTSSFSADIADKGEVTSSGGWRISIAGCSRGCRRRSRRCASAWTSSTAPRLGKRSPSTSRSSPTGTCGSRDAASGRETARPSRPCAIACSRSLRCWRRSLPSSPTRSTSTWPAARPKSWASGLTRCTCATSPSPTPISPTPIWKRRWRRCD